MSLHYRKNKSYSIDTTRFYYVLILIFLTVSLISGVSSGLMVEKTMPELVAQSDIIITGAVIDTQCQWDAEHLNIVTIATVKVDDVLSGSVTPGTTIQVITQGGTVDGLTQWVEDEPSLVKGFDMGLLLRGTPEDKYSVSGLYQGVFLLGRSDTVSMQSSAVDEFTVMIDAAKQGKIIEMSSQNSESKIRTKKGFSTGY